MSPPKSKNRERVSKDLHRNNGIPMLRRKPSGDSITSTRRALLQTKLHVGAANDRFEQEANATAKHVMSTPAAPARMQRKCASCGTALQTQSYIQRSCAKCDAKSTTPNDSPPSISRMIQRDAAAGTMGNAGGTVSPSTQKRVEGMRGSGGRPLDKTQREFFESRMGHDFSDVRLHVGPEAESTAKDLGAKAYTVGRDIAFGKGQYQPETSSGKELLAHELTHTVQQGAAGKKTVQAKALDEKDKKKTQPADAKDTAGRRRADISISLPSQRKSETAASKSATPRAEAKRRRKKTEIILPSQKKDENPSVMKEGMEDREKQPELRGEKISNADTGDGMPAGGDANGTGGEPGAGGTGAPPGDAAKPKGVGRQGGPATMTVAALAGPPLASKPFKISGDEPGAILQELEKVPPSQAAAGFNQARRASSAALAKQAGDEQAKLPEMKAPTGMEPRRKRRRRAWKLGRKRTPGIASGTSRDRRGRRMSTAVHLPADGRRTPTSLGRRPGVDMGGAADKGHLNTANARANRLLRKERNRAYYHANQNFGEKEIGPRADRTVLRAKEKIKKPAAPDIPDIAQGKTDPRMAAALDKSVGPDLSAKIGEQRKKGDAAAADAREKTARAHKDADGKIEALKKDASVKQEKTIKDAGASVNRHKKNYRSKISATERKYRRSAARATSNQKRKIDARRREGERQAARHFSRAEQKARTEKNKALGKVRAKQKEKEKGFLDYVGDAAKAFVRGLQKAINFIFDNLRKAVKWLFEQAKKLAVAAIELARSAIVTMIKTFGFVLKKFVGWYFRDIPWLAKRFQNLIDGAVKLAEKAVNAIASALKTAVSTVLDLLAKAVDWVLGLYQKIYNGILSVVYLLVSGNFAEIWKRLGHLGEAAAMAPSLFEQAAMEELTGSNLDEPLDAATLDAAGKIKDKFDFALPAAAPPGTQTGDSSSSPAGQNADRGPQAPWTDKNVGVEPVHHDARLHPDLIREARMKAGPDGIVEMGESKDPDRSMESVLAESREGGDKARGQTPAKSADGLTPMQRGKVRWEVMKEKLWNFLDKYKWWIAAGAVVAIAAIAAALIFSGGTILAALPGLMAALTKIFVAVTIATIAVPLTKYLELGWQGKIRPAAKEMARSWALLAIEFISWLTFKAGGAILKGTKTVVVGAARGIKTSARLTRLAAGGSRYFFRGAKVVFRSMKRSFFQGVRRLRVMGKMLMRKLRFRKFRIRFAGRRFFLEAKINPWVLILTGKLEKKFIPDDEVRPVSGTGKPERGRLVEVTDGGQTKRAIVLGDTKNLSKANLEQLLKRADLNSEERRLIQNRLDIAKRTENIDGPKKGTPSESNKTATTRPDKTPDEKLRAVVGDMSDGDLKLYQDWLKRIKRTRADLNDIPEHELAAIRGYTADDYQFINAALRSGDVNELRRLGRYINAITGGLHKLPAFTEAAMLVRRIKRSSLPPGVRRQLEHGTEFTERGYFSTSKPSGKPLTGDIELRILEHKSGRDISFLSRKPGEAEVLFPPGMKFAIRNRYFSKNGRKLIIEMVEL